MRVVDARSYIKPVDAEMGTILDVAGRFYYKVALEEDGKVTPIYVSLTDGTARYEAPSLPASMGGRITAVKAELRII